MSCKRILSVLLVLFLAGNALCAADSNFAREIERARAARVDELVKPPGWLTLTDRVLLKPGTHTIGRAADNDIVLSVGPAHFGTLTFENDRVTFSPASGAGVWVNSRPAPAVVELLAGDAQRRPTLVSAGTVAFQLVETVRGKGIHVRDLAHPQLVDFPGLDYYAIDPAWRFEAAWETFPEPRTLTITNRAGDSFPERVTGQAVFRRGDETIALLPLENPDGSLLFVFSDSTSGDETYPMRFLETGPPRDGRLVLDFNLAENPPCAFTPLAVCPLPPAQNRLKFPVRAGEKLFRSATH